MPTAAAAVPVKNKSEKDQNVFQISTCLLQHYQVK